MRRFGLVGNPLTHSWSQEIFTRLFRERNLSDCRYELFPREDLSGFREWIFRSTDLQGLNITIPFKVAVIPELDETDPIAREAGAVNTVRIIRRDGTVWLKGYNTDVDGFRGTLPTPPEHHSALVLGTGGASRAVSVVLKELGINVQSVSRSPADRSVLSYCQVDRSVIESHTLIVNTTPAGMFPGTDNCPMIPYEFITPGHLLIDLIYNPPETLFLRYGRERGARVINGRRMLELQAEKSLALFIAG